jgi:hypothetical protein
LANHDQFRRKSAIMHVDKTRRIARGEFILFLLLCLSLAGFFLPDWPLLSDLSPYLTSLWLLANWGRYRPKLQALLRLRTGKLLLGVFGLSVLSTLWSGATPTVVIKSFGYCLWCLGFVLAIILSLEEKPQRLYMLSTILLAGSLMSVTYGMSSYIQDRHTAENPRLHESLIPMARCQVPLDRQYTAFDVTGLSNLDCIQMAQHNSETIQYPYWRMLSYGKLDNAVLAALVYGLCLSLCLALLPGAATRNKLVVTATGLIFTIALYLCGSLGIVVGLGFAVAFALSHRLVSAQHWRQRYWLALACVAIVGLLLLHEYLSVLIAFLPRGLSFRDIIWTEMLAQMSPSDWLWGHGLGHSLQIDMASGERYPHAHSIYFTMLYSTGIIGIMMLMALLTTALVSTYKLGTAEARVAGTMLAFGMGGLALDGDQLMTKLDVHWLLIWLPLALIGAQQLRHETHRPQTLSSARSEG